MKMALEWGFIGHNPAVSVTMIPEQKKNPNPYTSEELERLLAALEHKPDKRDVAIVAVDTGMRKGELKKLNGRMSILNREAHMFIIRKATTMFAVFEMDHGVLELMRSLSFLQNGLYEIPQLD